MYNILISVTSELRTTWARTLFHDQHFGTLFDRSFQSLGNFHNPRSKVCGTPTNFHILSLSLEGIYWVKFRNISMNDLTFIIEGVATRNYEYLDGTAKRQLITFIRQWSPQRYFKFAKWRTANQNRCDQSCSSSVRWWPPIQMRSWRFIMPQKVELTKRVLLHKRVLPGEPPTWKSVT